jgi:DNA sulfur modification protein DndD
MIFEEVILHNFGVYQGRHAVSLEVSPDHPIVLIGAMNGSGKTTFLDAMQLALYGKSARCTGRERVSYHEYLESMINRDVPTSQGAGVEFAFRTRAVGQNSTIRVIRTWSRHGSGIRENLEVQRDGKVDAVASERWQEFVEDFMPSQIADLFFFDGEKIEALADPARSASLLKVGIHSLLGIDLVESLAKSLQQVERKRKTSGENESERAVSDALQNELLVLQEKRHSQKHQLAAYRTEGDLITNKVNAAAEDFKRLGGDLFARRGELEQEKRSLERRKADFELQLQDLAGGQLPLQLLSQLLRTALEKAAASRAANDVELLQSEAEKRDSQLIVKIRSLVNDRDLSTKIATLLNQDRVARYTLKAHGVAMPVGMLQQHRPEELARARASALRVLIELAAVKERLITVEANLGAVPDEAAIAEAQQHLDAFRLESAKIEANIALVERDVLEADAKISQLTQQLDRESAGQRRRMLEDEISARIVGHSVRVRRSLSLFREQLLQQNLDRLQISISACFRRLLRKQSLVSRVIICPETFQLSVINPGGDVVPAHRLSAGERQLLAVATLWALSQASGRHLPAVIDTPLSRLDSRHRGTIVKNYFPSASHQVILLSTDEEVVGRYYTLLEDHIGRTYLIDHDEDKRTSLFREGEYFSQTLEHEEKAA